MIGISFDNERIIQSFIICNIPIIYLIPTDFRESGLRIGSKPLLHQKVGFILKNAEFPNLLTTLLGFNVDFLKLYAQIYFCKTPLSDCNFKHFHTFVLSSNRQTY